MDIFSGLCGVLARCYLESPIWPDVLVKPVFPVTLGYKEDPCNNTLTLNTKECKLGQSSPSKLAVWKIIDTD